MSILKNIYPFREIARIIDLHFAKMESLAAQVDALRRQIDELGSHFQAELAHTEEHVASMNAKVAEQASAVISLLRINSDRVLAHHAENGRAIRKLASSIALLTEWLRTTSDRTAARSANEISLALEEMQKQNSKFAEDRAANDLALLNGMAALVEAVRERHEPSSDRPDATQT